MASELSDERGCSSSTQVRDALHMLVVILDHVEESPEEHVLVVVPFLQSLILVHEKVDSLLQQLDTSLPRFPMMCVAAVCWC